MGSRDVDTAQLQELFEPEKSVKNPFVPLGKLSLIDLGLVLLSISTEINYWTVKS